MAVQHLLYCSGFAGTRSRINNIEICSPPLGGRIGRPPLFSLLTVPFAMKHKLMRSAKLAVLLLAGCISFSKFALANAVASPNGGSQKIISFTPHDNLYAIAFHDDLGIAAGAAGLLLQSTDAGKNWTVDQKLPTELAMTAITVNGSRAIVVGQTGLILVREQASSWKKIKPVSRERLLNVSLNGKGLAIAVGAFGTLLKSTDFGETWEVLRPDWLPLYQVENAGDFVAPRDEPTFYLSKVFEDGTILIGGEYGQINRSTDGGMTWTPVLKVEAESGSTTPPTIFGMNFHGDGIGYGAGQNGLVVKTTDHGQTWQVLKTDSHASLYDVVPTGNGNVFAVGMRAGLVSEDSGKTWRRLDALDLNLNWYSGLATARSSNSNEVLAVGHSGRIVRLVANSH